MPESTTEEIARVKRELAKELKELAELKTQLSATGSRFGITQTTPCEERHPDPSGTYVPEAQLEEMRRERDHARERFAHQNDIVDRAHGVCDRPGCDGLPGAPQRPLVERIEHLTSTRDEARYQAGIAREDQNSAREEAKGFERVSLDSLERAEKAERERDEAQCLYRTEWELRKKAEDRLHNLDTGTQAEAVQGEAAWRERALVGEKALERAQTAQAVMVGALRAWQDFSAMIYPEDVFTGESGDPGAVAIAKARRLTRAATQDLPSSVERKMKIVKAAEAIVGLWHPLTVCESSPFIKAVECLVESVRKREAIRTAEKK